MVWIVVTHILLSEYFRVSVSGNVKNQGFIEFSIITVFRKISWLNVL